MARPLRDYLHTSTKVSGDTPQPRRRHTCPTLPGLRPAGATQPNQRFEMVSLPIGATETRQRLHGAPDHLPAANRTDRLPAPAGSRGA